MRKHFLILMLFALLPLAGWAADYSDYTVTLSAGGGNYPTAALPTVTLVEGANEVAAGDGTFSVAWSFGGQPFVATADPLLPGEYTATIAVADGNTAPTAGVTAVFTVEKGQISDVTISFTGNATTHAYTSDATALLDYTVNAKVNGSGLADLEYGTLYTAAWDAKAGGTGNMTTYVPGVYVLSLTAGTNYEFAAAATTSAEFTITPAIAVTTEPELSEDVTYNNSAKQVIATAGAASAVGTTTFYYAIVANGAAAPGADDANTWFTDITSTSLKRTNAASYDVYYKVTSTSGDEAAIAPTVIGTFTINQAAGSVTTPPTAKNLTYTGLAQALVNAGAGTGTMNYSLDNINWSDDIPTAKEAAIDDAAYKVYYKVLNSENYTAFQPTNATTGDPLFITVPIKKATLMVRAVNETIFYGQNPTLQIAYDGFVNGETVATLEAKVTEDADDEFDAAYWTTPTLTNGGNVNYRATAYDIIAAGGASKNYKFAYVGGKLTINKAKVKIVAQDATAVYGTDAVNTTSWTATKANQATYFKVYVQDGADGWADANKTQPKYKADAEADASTAVLNLIGSTKSDKDDFKNLTVSRAAGTNVNTNPGYAISVTGGDFQNNYELGQAVAGKYTITKGNLTFELKNFSKIYGESDPANWQSDYTLKMNGTAITTNPDNVKDKVTVTRVGGETAGSHDITLTVADKESFTNFTVTEPEPSVFYIERAPLTITALPQTLYLGNGVNKLDQNKDGGYTIVGLKENMNDVATVSLKFGEENIAEVEEVVPVYTTAEAEADVTGATVAGTLKTAGTYNLGIKVVLAEAETLAANYQITLNNGKLIVINTDNGIVLQFASDNREALASADGKSIPVTMGNKTMVADNWHTMVLPFATSPFELSQVLGQYVVVNRLSANSTASHVAFELELNEIPAGEAFLIKSGADIVWNGKVFEGVDGDDADTDPDGKQISKDISAESKGGNKLVGVYATTSVQSTDAQKIAWLGNTSQKKADNTQRDNTWYEPYTNPKDIAPFEAYLMYAPNITSAPLITVQDADGSTTAISEVKAGEFQAIKTDGWYTINGVKLEGAPTQKGIYINNGKKIVVK